MRSIHDFPILLTDSGEPLPITADPALIKHVLWNLINNAVRHAGADSQILVHTYPSANSRCIEVRDLGSGINPSERDSLFVPFQQLGANGQTPAGQGAGLGLAIVDRIVTLHGGEVLVDSLWGRGTSIHVLLPNTPTQPVRKRK
ncbi:ATP-binding protein [uncultured Actinomyces sp.]|nr:ATP-binding protein [uncultured Actinomyces sp.]